MGYLSQAQTVNADFEIPSEVCLDENVIITNNSSDFVSQEWDFCIGDFYENPVITNIAVSGITINTLGGAKVIFEDGNYYHFFVNRISAGKIYRSISNNLPLSAASSFTELSSITAQNPETISMIKDSDGNWVMYLGHLGVGTGIVRAKFGNGLTNAPTHSENIGVPIAGNRTRGTAIVKDGSNYFLLATQYNANRIASIKLGPSAYSSVGSGNITISPSFTQINLPTGIAAHKLNGEWIVFVNSFGNGTTVRLNYGNSLENTPSVERVYPVGMGEAADLRLVREGEKYFLFISSQNTPIKILDLGDMSNPENFTLLTPSNMPTRFGFDVYSEASVNRMVLAQTNRVDYFTFDKDCDSSIKFSKDLEPNLTFSSAGTKDINLTAFDAGGKLSALTKQLTVTENPAPAGEIQLAEAYCISDDINFVFDTEDAIGSFTWDFGDGSGSNDSNPSHQYSEGGNFVISLLVESPDGCSNTFFQELSIFQEAEADFQTTKSEYCSFEPISFENITAGDYGDNISWLWDFGDGNTSTEESPEHSYESAGTFNVRLTANVLGCVTFEEQVIEIIDGPSVAFTLGDVCLGESISLTNESTGEDITGYTWEVDGLEFSTDEHASISFSDPGTYIIRLSVENALGCNNSLSKEIKVYDQIIEDIGISEAIENLPFSSSLELIDEQPYSIIEYLWEINGQTSTDSSPSWVLEQGSYQLMVSILVDQNCSFTFQTEVIVQASEQPTVNFSVQEELCINEKIPLDNSSKNSKSFEWDFCPNDILEVPTINASILSLETTFNSFKLIEHNENYYGFGVGNNSNVYRLEYGSDISNTPEIINLGTFGLLNSAQGIDIHKEGEQWVGFVGHFLNSGGQIVRFVWNEIDEVPSAEQIGNLGVTSRIPDVKIIHYKGQYVVFFPYYNGSSLLRLNFGSSLLNEVSSEKITNTTGLSSLQFPIAVDLIQQEQEWRLVFASATTKIISVFNLGDNLTSTPSLVKSQEFPELGSLRKIKIHQELGKNFAFLSNGNKLELIDLIQLQSTDEFSIINRPNLPNSSGLDFISKGGRIHLFSSTNSRLDRVLFRNNCAASIDFSTEQNPTLSYSESGTYPITLLATHPNGSQASMSKEVFVSDNEAPDLSFEGPTVICIGSEVSFLGQSDEDIAEWSWTFGDNLANLSGSQINYTFEEAGEYKIQLSVEGESGCRNLRQSTLYVLPEPEPSFEILGDLICSNQNLEIHNTSELFSIPDSLIQYQWDFNGEGSSEEAQPNFSFSSGGEKNVTLQLSIPGCELSFSQSIQITEGPLVGFEADNTCFGEVVSFANTTSGEELVGFSWDFGDGYFGSEESPIHTYEEPGTYMVRLSVLNEAGCENFIEKEITVHSLPVAYFIHEPACAGTPINFQDSSSVANANLVAWTWEIRRPNTLSFQEISEGPNPQLEFEQAGTYEVKLTVESNFGCTDSYSQSVEVLPGPEFNIRLQQDCESLQATILDESSDDPSNAIESWTWQIEGNTYQGQEVEHVFSQAGTYTLQLLAETADNCLYVVEQEVTLLGQPQLDFVASPLCNNELSQFEDTSDLEGDEVLSRTWDFAGLGEANGRLAQFSFPEAGIYEVSLQIETANNCQRIISKSITIEAAPRARYETNINFLSPPANISFTNLSSGAESYQWLLDGEVISQAQHLDWTFSEEGEYSVSLLAIGATGCTDTSTQLISIRQPELDLALISLNYFQQNGRNQLLAEVKNKGTQIIPAFRIGTNIDGLVLSQRFNTPLNPGQERVVSLEVELSGQRIQELLLICVFAEIEGLEEAEPNLLNNEQCINLEQELNVLAPFPNPSKGIVHIPIILPHDGTFTLQIHSANGSQIQGPTQVRGQRGLNYFKLDMGSMNRGTYFTLINFEGAQRTVRLIKE